jgi:small-conductance mechanosensitive channel
MKEKEVMMSIARSTTKLAAFRLAAVLVLVPLASTFPQGASESSPVPGGDIVPFLNQTVAWYQQLTAQQQFVGGGNEILFFEDNRQVAQQVALLSFDFARARAQALSSQENADSTNSAVSGSSQYQRLAEMAGKAEQKVKTSQQELDQIRQRLNSATGTKRRTLEATVAETESELELFQARRDTIQSMLQVSSGKNASAGSLKAQIEELARTVPGAAEGAKGPGTAANPSSGGSTAPATVASQAQRTSPTGVLALISTLFSLRVKIRGLDDNIRVTDSLAQSAKALRTPLGAKIRELTQKGDAIAAQPDSTDPAVLAQQRKDLDELTSQYKHLSAALLPLGKQSILLDVYKRNTINWRNAVETQFEIELKGLLLRLAGLVLIIGAVLAISELWRRATFRYIIDARRRYQFLLLRRIIMWCLIATIIAVAFASELGAITTFAGLLTAGIAVALQNVILSVAGYFFLIGKYGLRVGDRVQVAGITGDVVDIGLVRLHLMEVTGGAGSRPTGRVVAFSNAVVFQANAGMFKQIPGTNFLWHEVTLALGPESNYREVEQGMMDAVTGVLAEYHDKIEMQRRNMERSLYSLRGSSFDPESRLRMTPSGVELVIRYPVELGNAAEIDDRVTRALIDTIGREPKLKLVGGQVEAQHA